MAEISGDRMMMTRVASGSLNFADPAQYRFVQLTGRDVHLCSASGQAALGIVQNKPQDNEHATVCHFGHTKVSLGNSLGAGSLIMTDNTGFGIAVASGGATLGRLLTGASSGKLGEMFFTYAGSGR